MKERVINQTPQEFSKYLLDTRTDKLIELYFDIETYQYNEIQGREKPTNYKNCIFSLAISYHISDNVIGYILFNNFKDFIELVKSTFKNVKYKNFSISLNAHNTNKYDNHYLRHDLIYYYDLPIKNLYIRKAETISNENALTISNLTVNEKKGIILEKRVKSRNNLDMIFYIDGIKFFTVDNYVKTNSSLDLLGKKLLNSNLITNDYLKTTFDYKKYNLEIELTESEARAYSQTIFENLDEKEHQYIRNDVIILALAVKYYSVIFHGFDYTKITLTQNILESYKTNALTNYQLLHKVDVGKKREQHLKYTDYSFAGKNFYDYLRPFYSGGLNFYNDKLIGKVIDEPSFSIDINSSYPNVMYNYKLPTFLSRWASFKETEKIEIVIDDDEYFLYTMTKQDFDNEIIALLDSKILRKMLVKYYTKTSDYIHINSYTIRLLKDIAGLDIRSLTVKSWVSFTTEYFGSREKISEYYYIKEQGKTNFRLDYKNPYEIKITKEQADTKASPEEIDGSKVNLNGLYGIPALRPYYNLFRYEGGEYVNYINGFENSERNIVFSIFVTSVALYNLLEPLKDLTGKEIDNNFIYCDTDSLYLKKAILHKLDKSLFNEIILGKWSMEEENISKIYILNHKKYMYENKDKNKTIKSAGIPLNSFNKNMTFEQFIDTQFSDGVIVENTKSIMNAQGTISIYESQTKIEKGEKYPERAFNLYDELDKALILSDIRNTYDDLDSLGTGLYIETTFGALSFNDVFKKEKPDKKPSISYLKQAEVYYKRFIY